MSLTEQITVTLPTEALAIARARVAAGRAASESEAIAGALMDSVLPPYRASGETFLEECARRYDAMRADHARGVTHEQAFAFLDDEQ